MSRILGDRPLLRLLRERRTFSAQRKETAEEIVREWRTRGIPEPAIALALKMADRWLKAVMR